MQNDVVRFTFPFGMCQDYSRESPGGIMDTQYISNNTLPMTQHYLDHD